MSSTGRFEHLPLANGDVAPVEIRVDGRARRISLKVEKVGGRVVLTAPTEAALPAARNFMSKRTNWIASRRAEMETTVPFENGAQIPVLGRMRTIRWSPNAEDPLRLAPSAIHVAGAEAGVPASVERFLKAEARRRLADAADDYAVHVGKPVARVTVRDQRTRWGSCAASGRLSFSWRLVMAPEFVLTYVAAHEVAHLKHMNHGPKFWALVADLHEEWREAEDWLDREGPRLRRYG